MALRWGVVGGGNISFDFCTAVRKNLSHHHHSLVAIATRDISRSKAFAEHHHIKKAYGSYQELAADEDVEVVYIGTIHTCHAHLSKMMLEAGKHVFCERPMGVTLEQTREVLALAKEKKLFFMEAFFMRNFPAYERLLSETTLLGDIRLVTGTFCDEVPPGGWDSKRELGGGGMMLYGQILFEYVNMIFTEMPESIVALGNLSPEGVDEVGSVVLKYSNGQVANFTYDLTTGKENKLTIYGKKGKIEVSDPLWFASEIQTPTGHYHHKLPEDPDYKYNVCGGLDYIAEVVRKCVREGLLECPLVTHRHSEITATVIQEVRKQIGVVYNEDSVKT